MFRYSCIIAFNTTFEWVTTSTFFYPCNIIRSFFTIDSPPPNSQTALKLRFSSIAKDLPEFRHLFRKSVCYALGLPTHGNCVEVVAQRLDRCACFPECQRGRWNFDQFCLHLFSSNIHRTQLRRIQVFKLHWNMQVLNSSSPYLLMSKTQSCRNVRC